MNHTIGVLIADDDWLIRKVVAVCLKQWPQYRLLGEAKDGATAVALAATLQPDLVLMDVQMPDLDGLQALAQMRQPRPGLPVVLMSAAAQYRPAALAAGANQFISKQGLSTELNRLLASFPAGALKDQPPHDPNPNEGVQ